MGNSVTFEKIDDDESWAIFDAASTRTLEMSGEEFCTRWDRGDFTVDESIDVMQVAMLRPSGR